MTEKKRIYLAYLESDEWKALKKKKFSEVGRICQNCTCGVGVIPIHVHHIRYRNLIDCLTTDLVVLCQDCHDTLHVALKAKQLQPEDAELPRIRELISWYKSTPESEKRLQRIAERKQYRSLNPRKPRKPRRHKECKKGRNALKKAIRIFQHGGYKREAAIVLMEEIKKFLDLPATQLPTIPLPQPSTIRQRREKQVIPENPDVFNVRSERGGYTRKALAALGVPWPPQKGWRQKLIEEHKIKNQPPAVIPENPIEAFGH